MARVLKEKELKNTRLATNYGGWMYCTQCDGNIGYLCYSTYDELQLKYTCNCGSKGEAFLIFEDSEQGNLIEEELTLIKNRLCCPIDQEPLITLLEKKLKDYQMEVTCKSCHHIYQKEK